MSEQRDSSELSFAHLNNTSNNQVDAEVTIQTSETPSLSPWRNLIGQLDQERTSLRRHQSFDLSAGNLIPKPIRKTLGVVPELSLPDSSTTGRKSRDGFSQTRHLTLRDFLRITEIDDHASNRRSSLLNASVQMIENKASGDLHAQLEYLVNELVEEQKLINVNLCLKQLYNKLNLTNKQYEISLAQKNPIVFQKIANLEGSEFHQLKVELRSRFELCCSQGKQQWKEGKAQMESEHFEIVSNINNVLHCQLKALEQSNQWVRHILNTCEQRNHERSNHANQIDKTKEEMSGLQKRLNKTLAANESMRKELSFMESKKAELALLQNERETLRGELNQEYQHHSEQDEHKDEALYLDELLRAQMHLHFFHNIQPFQLKKINEKNLNFQVEFQVAKLFKVVLEYGKSSTQNPPMMMMISVRESRCEPYSPTHFEEVRSYARHFLEPHKRVEIRDWIMMEEIWIKLNALQEFLDDLNALHMKSLPFIGFSLQDNKLSLHFCHSQKLILVYLKFHIQPFHYPQSLDLSQSMEIEVSMGDMNMIKKSLMSKLMTIQSGQKLLDRVVNGVNETLMQL
eukprot:g5595.t1